MIIEENKVLVIGTGFMAREYLNVLQGLEREVVVVGRGKEKLEILKKDFPAYTYFSGGVDKFLEATSVIPAFVINAASIGQLKSTSLLLINAGIKYLLLEKPGDLSIENLTEIKLSADKNNVRIGIAYNRRFYTSVSVLRNEAFLDGGITSAHFEFTEWIHTIDPAIYDPEALRKWIISNSSHVIDTVFALIGLPKELHSNVHGRNIIEWHPSGTIFSGSGVSEENIPFTYHSNWEGPGRWAIEISTRKRRYYLKPMEKLQQQLKGSVVITDIEINDHIDKEYKAGLFLQTQSFLNADFEKMVSIEDQIKTMPFYYLMGGY